MNNWRFVGTSALIFFVTHLLSVFEPFLLQADLFIIWALTVFFLDKNRRINTAVFFGSVIFFDFWSGSAFGLTSLAFSFTILGIFFIKNKLLIDSRGRFYALPWLAGFYYLYIFLNAGMALATEKFVFPIFSWVGFFMIILWFIIFIVLFVFYEKKRVPGFRL